MKKPTHHPEPANHIAVFQETAIRRVWHNEEWWFSVADVCAVLTVSADAGAYWRKLKQRLNAEGGQPVTFCHGLKLQAPDGKQRETDCANTEGLFRIIQSIPSPKAEPFKRWLAQVGYERIKEIENPELASARARELYQAKGYPQAWIEKRLRSISVRGERRDAEMPNIPFLAALAGALRRYKSLVWQSHTSRFAPSTASRQHSP